jgi:hypothetical protein
LGAKPPWEYAKESIAVDLLKDHFIPEKYAAYFHAGRALEKDEFQTFLTERSALIADEARKFLSI